MSEETTKGLQATLPSGALVVGWRTSTGFYWEFRNTSDMLTVIALSDDAVDAMAQIAAELRSPTPQRSA